LFTDVVFLTIRVLDTTPLINSATKSAPELPFYTSPPAKFIEYVPAANVKVVLVIPYNKGSPFNTVKTPGASPSHKSPPLKPLNMEYEKFIYASNDLISVVVGLV
jgi:hypothetical protein